MATADLSWLEVSAGSDTTLTAVGGTFSLTGGAATLTYTTRTASVSWLEVREPDASATLTADAGAFALTGGAATLTGPGPATALVSWLEVRAPDAAITLTAETGVFLASFAPSRSGFDIYAAAGSFALTGGDAALSYAGPPSAYTITAATGLFALAGGTAVLAFAGERREYRRLSSLFATERPLASPFTQTQSLRSAIDLEST